MAFFDYEKRIFGLSRGKYLLMLSHHLFTDDYFGGFRPSPRIVANARLTDRARSIAQNMNSLDQLDHQHRNNWSINNQEWYSMKYLINSPPSFTSLDFNLNQSMSSRANNFVQALITICALQRKRHHLHYQHRIALRFTDQKIEHIGRNKMNSLPLILLNGPGCWMSRIEPDRYRSVSNACSKATICNLFVFRFRAG